MCGEITYFAFSGKLSQKFNFFTKSFDREGKEDICFFLFMRKHQTQYMLFQANLIKNCKIFLFSQEVVTEIVFSLKFLRKQNFL
jgi:hypothetical protein